MAFSPLTSYVQLTSDSSPRFRNVDRFILHHAATASLQVILNLFQPGGRTVSANYALKDRTLVGTVDESRRAWTSSSAEWDGRAVTIEVANSQTGDPWPVSDESFDTLARLIADVATRHGFPITDDTVLTHQELYIRYRASYPTSCPGDLQRRKAELLNLARTYQQGPREQEIPEMATEVIVTSKNNRNQALEDKDRRAAFVNTDSGFVSSISWLTLTDADAYAKQVGMPAGALRFSDAGFDKYINQLALVRK